MYARVPSSSRACGGAPAVSRVGGRSQRTGPSPPRSDGGAVMYVPGPRQCRSRSASSQPIRYSSCGSSAAAPGATKKRARPVGVAHTGPSGSPIRSSRTSARRPAASATSITSKAVPTGSSRAAPGYSAQALVASSRPAPAGTGSAKERGCAPGAVHAGSPQEHCPETARAPGTTSQPHSPVYSATAVHSVVRTRRRAPPDRISRMPPIVKPMPPPTGRARRWLRPGAPLSPFVTVRRRAWRAVVREVVRAGAHASPCFRPPTPEIGRAHV